MLILNPAGFWQSGHLHPIILYSTSSRRHRALIFSRGDPHSFRSQNFYSAACRYHRVSSLWRQAAKRVKIGFAVRWHAFGDGQGLLSLADEHSQGAHHANKSPIFGARSWPCVEPSRVGLVRRHSLNLALASAKFRASIQASISMNIKNSPKLTQKFYYWLESARSWEEVKFSRFQGISNVTILQSSKMNSNNYYVKFPDCIWILFVGDEADLEDYLCKLPIDTMVEYW